MPWLEIFSILLAVIAVIIAAGSLLISRRAHKISEMQVLPRIDLVRTWAGWERGRNLYVKIEQTSDRPDWVVARASVRRTWKNWRQRCFLARGEVTGWDELGGWRTYPICEQTGGWEQFIAYEPPIKEVVIFLPPEAPDCYVTLEIRLITAPSPTIKRHINSQKESPASRIQRSVIE